MIKARPILFNGDMVRAVLAGTKTQTRRVIKNIETLPNGFITPMAGYAPRSPANHAMYCPYGVPGEMLWVRETFAPRQDDEMAYERWSLFNQTGPKPAIYYAADLATDPFITCWKPSIHMPRWASRITLLITAVRVERLQDIREEDAKAEGVDLNSWYTQTKTRAHYCHAFMQLWEAINGHGSWDKNPWVWVVEFKRVNSSQ